MFSLEPVIKLKKANARAGLLHKKAPSSETQRNLLAFERQLRKVDYTIIRVHKQVDAVLDALEIEPENAELRVKAEKLIQRSKNFQAQKATMREAVREIRASCGLANTRI